MKKFIALLMSVVLCLCVCSACGGGADPAKDLENAKEAGKIVVAITNFAPMDYHPDEASKDWIGFDADMAKAFGEYLGVDVEFKEIEWDKKVLELNNGSIDVVWNGMTITGEVTGAMDVGVAYCKNKQVVVVKKDIADTIKSKEDLKKLTFAAESESAGAECLDELNIEYAAVGSQGMALLEVNSGTSQACVIDLLMAGAMIGEGTDNPDLTMVLDLSEEEYGVGFRQGSNLVPEFNEFWKKAYADGTVQKTAEKYGIAQNLIDPEK